MSANAQFPPLVVIVGPTAVGKTDLAVRLAQAVDGEIVRPTRARSTGGWTLAPPRQRARSRNARPTI